MQPRGCEALKGLEWGVAGGGPASTLTGKRRQSSRHHARTHIHINTHTHTHTEEYERWRTSAIQTGSAICCFRDYLRDGVIWLPEASHCCFQFSIKKYILRKRGSRGCHVEAIGDFATKVAWNNYYLFKSLVLLNNWFLLPVCNSLLSG